MTLSPTQLYVLRKMRDGWRLEADHVCGRLLLYPNVEGGMAIAERALPSVVAWLLSRKLILAGRRLSGTTPYALTPAGLAALEAAEKEKT